MTNVELVLFFGPPFIGKTFYFFKRYSKTHVRISAQETFQKEKVSNLRAVILKAVGLLSKGRSVVIDDENWYVETRRSYCNLVKQKVKKCAFTIVQFIPDGSFGYQQCLWAREWALVCSMLSESSQRKSVVLSDSEERLDCWFSKRRVFVSNLNPPEFPTAAEGFSLVAIKPDLTCDTPYKFSLPGLFLQWNSIITGSDGGSVSFKRGTPDLLNKWFNKNPSGRTVIIGLKSKLDKEIVDEKTKLILSDLTSQVVSPIYFLLLDEKRQPDHYSKLPSPGILAFLQRLHTIDFYHKGTMYVYESDEHYKAAVSVGIRTIKAEKLFAHTHLIDAVYCGETTPSLVFLKNLEQINCHRDISSNDDENQEAPEEACIPFLSRARKSSSPFAWKYCDGKVNGICFKDKMVLERYQTQFALAAQPAVTPGKTSPKRDTTRRSVSTVSQTNVSTTSSSVGLNTTGLSCLANVDLREVAETPGRYQGGFLCKEKIFNLNVEVLDCQKKISCNCMGSTGQSYDVEATLSDLAGVIEARCSCPDPVGKNGRCKHVIGLLLNYKERHASLTGRKENEASFCHRSESNRSLPTWMSSGASKSLDEKTRDGCSLKATKKIRDNKSPLKRGVHTLYCMSEDELVQTAKEVLQKHGEAVTKESGRASVHEASERCFEESTRNQESSVVTVECKSDDLEDLIFGARENQGKSYKKICREKLPSFAEETPPEKLLSSIDKDCSVSVIIPDSLVPETVSLIPETVSLVSEAGQSGNDCSPHEEENNQSESASKLQESFQDFLDELM